MKLLVTQQSGHRGTLVYDGAAVPCALGPGGIRAAKQEGDGVTPAGRFPLRAVHYRADRIPRPVSGLPVSEIARHDGWCDDPADPAYNRPVTLPYPASAEHMWRDDAVYDLLVVIGHNDDPVRPGAGSAIFMHLVNTEFGPTGGCVALEYGPLKEIVARLGPGDTIDIAGTAGDAS